MQKLSALIALSLIAAMPFGVQAKEITRSCNFTVQVFGCKKLRYSDGGVTCYDRNPDYLGAKSGSMTGTALTAYGARFEARKNIYSLAEKGSPLVVPVISLFYMHSYPKLIVMAKVSGDTGCKRDRGYLVEPSSLP